VDLPAGTNLVEALCEFDSGEFVETQWKAYLKKCPMVQPDFRRLDARLFPILSQPKKLLGRLSISIPLFLNQLSKRPSCVLIAIISKKHFVFVLASQINRAGDNGLGLELGIHFGLDVG